jgi:FkbM family methyltransferase
MISYAQNCEDVLLNRAFRGIPNGSFVDVGANHPSIDSVTKHFYDRGWSGINIEPGSVFSMLQRQRPRDVNLQIAASNRNGRAVFYEHPLALGTSTLSPKLPDTVQELSNDRVAFEVELKPLSEILSERALSDIQFMSIDVEGHEKAVIEGNDWGRFRPRVLVIESTIPNTNTFCHHSWEPLLVEADYEYVFFDGINRYYVRHEDRHLSEHFQYPVNVLDDFVPAETVQLRQLSHRYRQTLAEYTKKLALAKEQYDASTELAIAREIEINTMNGDLFAVREELDSTKDKLESVQAELESTREELAAVRSRLESVPENGKPVTAESAFDDKGAEIIDHGDTEANATSSNGSPHPKSLEPLEQKIRLCEEELEATQKELEWRRGQVESYEKDLAHRASEVQSLRAALEDKEANYQWMTRRTGPKSLAAGLKVARKIHWLTRR